MSNNTRLLEKMSSFTKKALSEIQEKDDIISDYLRKEASDKKKWNEFSSLLKQAAQALYDSDFITDEPERRTFLKRAQENPAYALSVLVKVCNAADVALIGKTARVAAKPKDAEYDPVMAKAFGWYGNSNTIIDD